MRAAVGALLELLAHVAVRFGEEQAIEASRVMGEIDTGARADLADGSAHAREDLLPPSGQARIFGGAHEAIVNAGAEPAHHHTIIETPCSRVNGRSGGARAKRARAERSAYDR